MRINSAASIRTGKSLRERFPSWAAVKKAARYEDGKYTISSGKDNSKKDEKKK